MGPLKVLLLTKAVFPNLAIMKGTRSPHSYSQFVGTALLCFIVTSISNTAALQKDGGVNLNSLDEGPAATSHISTNPACQSEISRLCGRKPQNLEDLDVLECVMNQKVTMKAFISI